MNLLSGQALLWPALAKQGIHDTHLATIIPYSKTSAVNKPLPGLNE
jgi:hypothetical protein